MLYQAIFHPTLAGYTVRFPALPGCTAYGTDSINAIRKSQDALHLYLAALQNDGEALPPSDADVRYGLQPDETALPLSDFEYLSKPSC